MSLSIQTEKDSFYPGEKVKGVLSVNVPKPMRARKVLLSFEGKEHVLIVVGSGKHRQVFTEDNYIINEKIDVWTPTNGEILGPCNELFPFEFELPPNALPTVKAQGSPINGIAYEIKAKIDRPRALDRRVNCILRVLRPPMERFPTEAIVQTLPEPKGKIQVEVYVEKTAYVPGEQVVGRVRFTQDPLVKVRAVEISLQFIEHYRAQGRTFPFPYISGQLRNEVDPLTEFYEWPFAFTSFGGDFYSVDGKLVTHEWVVDVKVDLPLKRDPHVVVPLLFLPLRTPALP